MYTTRNVDFEGGYYVIDQDLMRHSIHKHTAALGSEAVSDETIEALNTVQATPWRVNHWILDTMMAAYESGMEVGDLPYHDDIKLPRKDDTEWEAMDEEERKAWKQELAAIHAHNARLSGRRRSFANKLSIAIQMQHMVKIWFPHFLDFRTRIYPIPQDLHPQSDDIGKSLLEFAEGKPLGYLGRFWLAVRLANTFGEDKMSLEDRVGWVFDHEELIIDSGMDPLDGQRFWEKADEPWQFLATCREWALSSNMDDPTEFCSHLPVNVDGSCNGLQHLAAMGRDRVGAEATNVANNSERQDIYQQVADRVNELVSQDAADGVEEAHQWVGQISRKTVKRAVMTTPYGVTPKGVADQLVADGHTQGMQAQRKAASYLRDKITEAIDTTVISAKQIMSWIQTCAIELSRHGIPLTWSTPVGNTICQSYHQLNEKRVYTLYGKLTVWDEDPVGGLQDRKQMLASAPNVIHSFDAAHLVTTVNRLADLIPDASFSMVHDSFGVHAADVAFLSDAIRETFIEIYSEDWLTRLHHEFQTAAPDVELPDPYEFILSGDFEVEEVRQSEFFFA